MQLNWVRAAIVATCMCLSSGLMAQSSFFTSVRPQASIVIKKHSTGADMVEVTVLGSDYPVTVLVAKLDSLGKILGAGIRGLETSQVEGAFLKATFATNGLVTPEAPKVNLKAVAQMFAFGDRPIKEFTVFYDGLKPDPAIPSKWFAPKDVWLFEGQVSAQPRGIEYRVKVNTTNVDEIKMPDEGDRNPKNEQVPEKKQGNIYVLIGIIAGAVGVGLLVYSALLRPRNSAK
ncbi:MAG TPA: hypothetical protein VK171_08080 [Fimbriimonas sp.]|nr:hypothetical protein [Fimbriimonas sp.]